MMISICSRTRCTFLVLGKRERKNLRPSAGVHRDNKGEPVMSLLMLPVVAIVRFHGGRHRAGPRLEIGRWRFGHVRPTKRLNLANG